MKWLFRFNRTEAAAAHFMEGVSLCFLLFQDYPPVAYHGNPDLCTGALVSSVWCVAFGVWCVVCGVWCAMRPQKKALKGVAIRQLERKQKIQSKLAQSRTRKEPDMRDGVLRLVPIQRRAAVEDRYHHFCFVLSCCVIFRMRAGVNGVVYAEIQIVNLLSIRGWLRVVNRYSIRT